jgi:hypothetical protein
MLKFIPFTIREIHPTLISFRFHKILRADHIAIVLPVVRGLAGMFWIKQTLATDNQATKVFAFMYFRVNDMNWQFAVNNHR